MLKILKSIIFNISTKNIQLLRKSFLLRVFLQSLFAHHCIKNDCRKELKHIQNQIQKLENRIMRKSIHVKDVDNLTEKTLSLTKNIFESQFYSSL